MAIASNLGFPRIGYHRQLKQATEKYWAGKASAQELLDVGRSIRVQNWQIQKDAGIEHIPSNDFSFYDHILDTAVMLGAIPDHYLKTSTASTSLDHAIIHGAVPAHDLEGSLKNSSLDISFHLARGCANEKCALHPGQTVAAWEMTKWFDTNYHYIVPTLKSDQQFQLLYQQPLWYFLEAKSQGISTRPVIIGPVSFLMLCKIEDPDTDRFTLLPSLLPVYLKLLNLLKIAGAEWVQIDEPCLILDLDSKAKQAYKDAYEYFSKSSLKLLLTAYFCRLGDNLELALNLPTAGIHLDYIAGDNLESVASRWPQGKVLSAGVVDGRNIWVCDLERTLHLLSKMQTIVGNSNLIVAPSCSLLHVPLDLDDEKHLDKQIRPWLAFAKQKLTELSLLNTALSGDSQKVRKEFETNKLAIANHRSSPRVHNTVLKSQLANLSANQFKRNASFDKRKPLQQKLFNLPLLPTTTIGSFPQTKEIRKARADFKTGIISQEEYKQAMRAEISHALTVQNDIGLDVLVHGEAERNDMVEYFAEFLDGYVFTEQGWVQSYGSRCVKPPIIYGDIIRKQPMTVEWSVFAQEQANRLANNKPVKGMLTGPVTMLQWSFVRNDQPRSQTCQQLAWAIREEVSDLERNGIKIIQIDEPAIREGLPLKKADWQNYLNWAVQCFRLSSSSVKDETQIHTHMCYSQFNDIIESVAALDADVVSIEAARSELDLLDAFVKFKYPNDIGPGVYDIHSPRIPPELEMLELLEKALNLIDPKQLWINPDCGLKTRNWTEVIPALKNMVAATQILRARLKEKAPASV